MKVDANRLIWTATLVVFMCWTPCLTQQFICKHLPTSHSSLLSISSMSWTIFLRCPCSIPNLCEIQETSLAQEIAESFRAKSTESFRLVKIDDLRLVDILMCCVFLLWLYWMVTKH